MTRFVSMAAILFVGSLYVMSIGVLAATDENCERFWALKVDFSVTYTSTQTFPVQFGYQCAAHCSADGSCVAMVTSKTFTDQSEFCQILLHQNEGSAQEFGARNIEANQQIWVASAATTTLAAEATTTEATTAPATTAVSCPDGFTATSEGCFFLDSTQTLDWDAAEQECSSMGVGVHLATTDSSQVKICPHLLGKIEAFLVVLFLA